MFEVGGVKFSTPICFEDVFGYISRRFVREGAEVIVNMTNDSWSGSVAAQMQHLGMAVFRAVGDGVTDQVIQHALCHGQISKRHGVGRATLDVERYLLAGGCRGMFLSNVVNQLR